MIEWVKTLFRMISDYKLLCERIDNHGNDIMYLKEALHACTEVHLDIHHKDYPTSVIVIGRFRNKDYVRSFNFHTDGMDELLGMMKFLEKKYGRVSHIDAPPMFDACIEHSRHNLY